MSDQHDDRIHAETTPDGGVRIQASGIDIRVSEDALKRAESEGGLGFNYALTPEQHEALPPLGIEHGDSPIDTLLGIGVHLRPRDISDE